jgi:hypothetical protein
MDRPHVRECSFDAAVFSKICKHNDTPHDMLAPAWTRRFDFVTGAMLLYEAQRQISGKLVSQLIPIGTLDEVLPNCSISITRSPAVAQPVEFAQRVGNKALQRDASKVPKIGLLHNRPPFEPGDLMAAEEAHYETLCAVIQQE